MAGRHSRFLKLRKHVISGDGLDIPYLISRFESSKKHQYLQSYVVVTFVVLPIYSKYHEVRAENFASSLAIDMTIQHDDGRPAPRRAPPGRAPQPLPPPGGGGIPEPVERAQAWIEARRGRAGAGS